MYKTWDNKTVVGVYDGKVNKDREVVKDIKGMNENKDNRNVMDYYLMAHFVYFNIHTQIIMCYQFRTA